MGGRVAWWESKSLWMGGGVDTFGRNGGGVFGGGAREGGGCVGWEGGEDYGGGEGEREGRGVRWGVGDGCGGWGWRWGGHCLRMGLVGWSGRGLERRNEGFSIELLCWRGLKLWGSILASLGKGRV